MTVHSDNKTATRLRNVVRGRCVCLQQGRSPMRCYGPPATVLLTPSSFDSVTNKLGRLRTKKR